MGLIVKELSHNELDHHLDDLGRLRIQVFKEFPYLYDGDLDYEKKYLSTYKKSPRSLILMVFDGAKPVGASTGLPMCDDEQAFNQAFIDQGYTIENIFYFGESIILPEYRGQGIGKEFFKLREAHAEKVIKGLEYTTFCAVNRPQDHPLRPPDYQDLSTFWQTRGYQKDDSLQAHYDWKDIDKENKDFKTLTYWLKKWS